MNSPLFTNQQLTPANINASETLLPQLPEKPIAATASMQLYIIPTEKTLFFQGFEPNEYNERQPVLLRGCLFLRVLKPSKVKSISLSFTGQQRTDWPEGIPPKRTTYVEESDIINHTWPFYSMANPLNTVNGGADLYSELPKNLDRDISHLNLNDPVQRAHSPSISTLDTSVIGGRFLMNLTAQTSRKNTSPTLIPVDSFNDLQTINTAESDIGKPGIFPPGDYIYNFEHPLRPSMPETTHVTFGEVCYSLEASVIRSGAFKSNLVGKLPIDLVRTPSELNQEENEPIVISRDWEDQLRYDIVIGGKSIILDSYLPLAFRFVPLWGKVALHRIRVYLTENLEYYCQDKKVHRMEPAKKFLLLEHKAKKGKSLLSKKENGEYGDENDELLPRELEFQLYVPQTLNGKINHVLHPDTSFTEIQSHHWVKLCLRISRVDPENPDKRKHYEISIDSPIHILSPLAAHGNTLLPAYDSGTVDDYFLPEYTPSSPPLSPGVEPIDNTHNIDQVFSSLSTPPAPSNAVVEDPEGIIRVSSPDRFYHLNSSNNNDEPIERDLDMHLDANLYKPDEALSDSRSQLNSPQAIPHPGTFSPINSPLMRPIHVLRRPSYHPPPFEETSPPPNFDVVPPPAYQEEDSGSNNSSIKQDNSTRSSRTNTVETLHVHPPEISIRDLLTNSFSQTSTRNSISSKRTHSSSESSQKPSIEEPSIDKERKSTDSNSASSLRLSRNSSLLNKEDPLNPKLEEDSLSPKLEKDEDSEEDIVNMLQSPNPSAVSPTLLPMNSPKRGMSPIPMSPIPMSPIDMRDRPTTSSDLKESPVNSVKRSPTNSPKTNPINIPKMSPINIPKMSPVRNDGYQSSIESSSRRESVASELSNDFNVGQSIPLLSSSTQSLITNGPIATRTASVGSILFETGNRRLSSTNRPTMIDFVDGDLGGDFMRHNFNTKIFNKSPLPSNGEFSETLETEDKVRSPSFGISNVKGSDSEGSSGTLNKPAEIGNVII